MRISVCDAKAQLTDLVRRAEEGDDVVLTRHGHDVVRLAPIAGPVQRAERRKILDAVRASGAAKAKAGPGAARSQDFLYGRSDGLSR